MPRRSSAPSPHLTLTLAQGPTPCRCPGWEAGSRGGTPGSPGCSSARGDWGRGAKQLPPAAWQPRTLLSLLVGTGAARHRCSPLLWAWEARLGLQELVFAPCLALQQGHTAPAPTGLQRCLCRAIFSHAWLPCARSRCRGYVKKGAERCKRFHDGYKSPESVRGDQMCPLRSCEPGAMPAASGRAGGMPQRGTGWGVGPGAAPLGSGGDRHRGGIAG